MTDEIEKLERKIHQLRTTNAGLTSEIEQLGGGIEVSVARIEHFIKWICIELDLPEERRLNEQVDWETALRAQLIPIRDKIRDQRQAEVAEARRRQAEVERSRRKGTHKEEKPGLWTPGKN